MRSIKPRLIVATSFWRWKVICTGVQLYSASPPQTENQGQAPADSPLSQGTLCWARIVGSFKFWVSITKQRVIVKLSLSPTLPMLLLLLLWLLMSFGTSCWKYHSHYLYFRLWSSCLIFPLFFNYPSFSGKISKPVNLMKLPILFPMPITDIVPLTFSPVI